MMKKVIDTTIYRVVKPKDKSTNLSWSPQIIKDGFYKRYTYSDGTFEWFSIRETMTNMEDSLPDNLVEELEKMSINLEQDHSC